LRVPCARRREGSDHIHLFNAVTGGAHLGGTCFERDMQMFSLPGTNSGAVVSAIPANCFTNLQWRRARPITASRIGSLSPSHAAVFITYHPRGFAETRCWHNRALELDPSFRLGRGSAGYLSHIQNVVLGPCRSILNSQEGSSSASSLGIDHRTMVIQTRARWLP